MTSARVFTADQLKAWGVPDDLPTEQYAVPEAAVELHREQVETRRWVSVHWLVFRAPDDGKTYRLHFEQGLTEMQEDTDPWDYARTVEAVEVEQRPRTVMEWQPLGEQPATPPSVPVDRAVVLREAADVAACWPSDCQNCAVEMEVASELCRMADEAQQP